MAADVATLWTCTEFELITSKDSPSIKTYVNTNLSALGPLAARGQGPRHLKRRFSHKNVRMGRVPAGRALPSCPSTLVRSLNRA